MLSVLEKVANQLDKFEWQIKKKSEYENHNLEKENKHCNHAHSVDRLQQGQDLTPPPKKSWTQQSQDLAPPKKF